MYEIKGSFIPPNSLESNCTPCLETKQCKAGGYCYPYMKRCVKTATQTCSPPIAGCRPVCSEKNCITCKNQNYKVGKWQKDTC